MIASFLLAFGSILICSLRSQETYAKKDVSDVYNLYTTQAFYVRIASHQLDQALQSGHPVEFMASIAGMPDLPVWMHYRHLNGSEAYLYGSPPANDDGDVEIEVIAINQYNYETVKDVLKFRIIRRERRAKFEVEMKFVNYNIDDMFQNNRFDDVLQVFSDKLWKDSDDVYITKIASPLDVGGRLPLDPREKEGVIIRIGSTDNYTRDLLDLEREVEVIKNRNPCPRKYKATSAEYMFRTKGFHSDWCSFMLIRKPYPFINLFAITFFVLKTKAGELREGPHSTPDTRPPARRDNYFEDGMVLRYRSPKRNYIMDLVLCFLVPVIIGTTIVSSLTCIFFYNKQRVIKACNETPVQLEQYHSISRATFNLRSLANDRHQSISGSLSPYQTWTLPRTILKKKKQKVRPQLPEAWMATSLPVSRTTSFRHSIDPIV